MRSSARPLFPRGPIPQAGFGLVWVAASVREWTKHHSRTLAATTIEKQGVDMRVVGSNAPELAPELFTSCGSWLIPSATFRLRATVLLGRAASLVIYG